MAQVQLDLMNQSIEDMEVEEVTKSSSSSKPSKDKKVISKRPIYQYSQNEHFMLCALTGLPLFKNISGAMENGLIFADTIAGAVYVKIVRDIYKMCGGSVPVPHLINKIPANTMTTMFKKYAAEYGFDSVDGLDAWLSGLLRRYAGTGGSKYEGLMSSFVGGRIELGVWPYDPSSHHENTAVHLYDMSASLELLGKLVTESTERLRQVKGRVRKAGESANIKSTVQAERLRRRSYKKTKAESAK
jgi:hypothetical protein